MSHDHPFPKLNLAAVTEELKRVSSETAFLKRWLRQYSSSPFSFRTAHEDEFKEHNARLIELKKRATLLCSLRAHCRSKIHLLDVLEFFCETQMQLDHLMGLSDKTNKMKLVDRMFFLQEDMLTSSGVVEEFKLVR